MEASSSSGLINSFAIQNIALNLNIQVLINIFFYAAAATSGVLLANKIITLLFEELLKILHYKWLTKYKDKKEVAIAVIKICTEGSTTGWNVKPREYEHIYFIARLLEGVDKKAGELFDRCISSWSLNAIMQDSQPGTAENIKFCTERQNEAQTASGELLGIVQKWR